MALKYTNNASSTIASGINTSATTITLATGEGAEFPTLSAGDYFYGTLVDTNAGTTEIVKVTARSTDTLTVVRGQDNTTAASWGAGTRFDLRVCAALLADLSPVSSVAGRTGAVTLSKSDVGLGNVDNTSDADKPISTATQTALDAKQALDADLTAIAALAGTSGLLKKTAANTWSLDTSTYLTSAVTSVSGTAPIVSSGGNTPAISISAATTSAAGSMSATDKAKLDGIASGATANTGTVTFVAVTVPTGLSVTGTPVTTSGTLAISLTSGYSIPTTASQTNWDTAYTDRNKWDGGATGLTAATGRTSLGLGTAAVMTGPSGAIVGTTDTQTLSQKTITGTKETVYTISDGASVDIDPANGGIQVWTLGANRTPTATNFTEGQSVTLMIADGAAYAVTWTTIGVVWVGGTAPTLPTSGYGVIELWKISTTVYGASAGSVA